MTHSTSGRHTAGTVLLKLARLIFDEDVVASLILPTIADLQQEIADAREDPIARLRARIRGYVAFWWLALLAPFAAHTWPIRRDDSLTLPVTSRGAGGWLLLAGALGFTSPALGTWSAAWIVGGLIVAVVIHAWNRRHPALVVTAGDEVRRPEINFSSLPVGGNIGGLIFMAGSMAILVAGLPAWHWFFGGAVLGGVLTAVLLKAWHAAHPHSLLPENRIVLR